jgi:hypothetical protein
MKNASVLTERGIRERERDRDRQSESMNLTIISFILRSHLQRQTKCQIQT